MNVWWVPVLCAAVSVWYGHTVWRRGRLHAFAEGCRLAALAELQRSGDAGNDDLISALAANDATDVERRLAVHSGTAGLGVELTRRFVDAAQKAAYADSGRFPRTLLIILIHSVGAFVVAVHQENDAGRAYDHSMRVIGLAHMVGHIDSAFGHTVVFVVYRPDIVTEARVRALGAVVEGSHRPPVEFYPVACCVSLDSGTHYFQHSALPYRQRFVGGGGGKATMSALRALDAGEAPSRDGFVSVVDPNGTVVAHWNTLPDSSELRDNLH